MGLWPSLGHSGKVAPEDLAAFDKMTFDQRIQMIQQILEERFALKVHHETRILPVYALVLAKSGVKMTRSKVSLNDLGESKARLGVLTGGEGKSGPWNHDAVSR